MQQSKIDWLNFGTCLAIMLLVCIPLAESPETGGALLQSMLLVVSTPILVVGVMMSVALVRQLKSDAG